MKDNIILWDKKINNQELKRVLTNPVHPRFVEIAALFLSRINKPSLVFSDYLDKVDFCINWRRIKARMRSDKWNEPRILFWDEIYNVVLKEIGKDKLQESKKRLVKIDPEIKNISIALKAARKASGLTQAELAKKAKLSQQTISFIEQGYINISLQTLQKITQALNLKVELKEKA